MPSLIKKVVKCPEFLDQLEDRRCVEEFIKLLPMETRNDLVEIINIINQYIDIERLLLSYIDQYYLMLLSLIDEQIAFLEKQYQIYELYRVVKQYWIGFGSCPGINILARIIENQLNLIANKLNERVFQKNRMLGFLQQVGLRNSDLLLKKVLIGDTGVLTTTQDFLTGFAQCLEKGIPGVNPPYSGEV